ncbi:MAG: hypothetical protein ACLQPD_34720 [Desulfomonilaceae bacterium]
MDTETYCNNLAITKIHNAIIRIAGYAKILLVPIAFSEKLIPEWVPFFKESYKARSTSKSEDILYEPADYETSGWNEAPLSNVLFLALNERGIDGHSIEPEPKEAMEWLNRALKPANSAFQKKYCENTNPEATATANRKVA